jgi:hypothetical protein
MLVGASRLTVAGDTRGNAHACRGIDPCRDGGESACARSSDLAITSGVNSEAGHVSGRIIKVHTRDTEYKGHPCHASEDEPQYEIESDKTGHVAMHKGLALHKID